MLNRILCVDDETNVLQAIERQFRRKFEIHTALGPEAGLQAVQHDGPFAVIVSDLRMPGMDGIRFLTRVRECAPDTVRIMLTGHADLTDAIAAVNQGNIFQFLTKPCRSEMLARALNAALEQYSLITSERELLEKTLVGSIGVMTEILGLVNPDAFSRAQRIRRYVRQLSERLQLPNRWQCEFAAMLCQIGTVAVPFEVAVKRKQGLPLDPTEQEMLASQHRLGHDLLVRIPRLEGVADMVLHQNECWGPSTTLTPAQMMGHLLRVALDFDEQLVLGATPEMAIAEMRSRHVYNPRYLEALEAVQVEEASSEVLAVKLAQLRPGMVINADVKSKTNLLLLAKGQEVTDSALACLRRFASGAGVQEPISVIVPPVVAERQAELAASIPG
ncbi:MAG: response regulator [Acidobacteria bacterium]|nr:response regulator [Acidobacteriota bacterium]